MKPARRQTYYLIPFNLALLVRREKLVKEFQIWLLLKHWSNGHLEITPQVIGRLATILHCSERTIGRAVARLRDRSWLGYNQRNGLSYVRGIDTLRIIERLPERLAVWFNIDKILQVGAFFSACRESYFVRGQKVKIWRERAAGVQKKRGTVQPVSLPPFYPIALSLHQSFFGIPKSTAARERKAAAAAGFLLIHKIPPIPLTTNNPSGFLRGWPEKQGHLFRKDNVWYIRQTDEVQTNLLFKRRPRLNR